MNRAILSENWPELQANEDEKDARSANHCGIVSEWKILSAEQRRTREVVTFLISYSARVNGRSTNSPWNCTENQSGTWRGRGKKRDAVLAFSAKSQNRVPGTDIEQIAVGSTCLRLCTMSTKKAEKEKMKQGESNMDGRLFGSKLPEVRGQTGAGHVPPIVLELVTFLVENDAAAEEGLFRIAGSSSTIDALKAAYDRGTFRILLVAKALLRPVSLLLFVYSFLRRALQNR